MEKPVTIDEVVEGAKRLHQAGRFAEAEAIYRRVLEESPDHAESIHFLGVLALQRGDAQGAVELIRRADAIRPGNGGYLSNLGVALLALSRHAEAAEVLRQATAARPDLASAFGNLGTACKQLGRFDEAIAAFERAIVLNPRAVESLHGLGGVLFETGSAAKAIEYLSRALAIEPGMTAIDSARLFMMGADPAFDAKRLLAEARGWNGRHAVGVPTIKKFENDRNPNRRLKIGYVSADFREHSVGRFMVALLGNHDRRAVEIFCYSNAKAADRVTEKLRGFADHWREIAHEPDERAAEMIGTDGIDVLVDLSMHTADNRMLLFARRPAPVQITYLAYCGTTGVEAIDYRLSDPWLDPPGSDESVYSEKTIRLPACYWCYQASEQVPAVNALPALSAGGIVFGSLNNFFKVNEPVLRAWAEILRRVKGSRLLLHSPEGSHRARAANILGEDRVEFVGKGSLAEYFALYQRMDISLDTFPYAGGTITCDALWMGVPVVSLAGKTSVGRGGVSILSNLGYPEFIAATVEEYVEIAVRTAKDSQRLAEFRGTVRERMKHSVLMDAPSFARSVEQAYREAWAGWAERSD